MNLSSVHGSTCGIELGAVSGAGIVVHIGSAELHVVTVLE